MQDVDVVCCLQGEVSFGVPTRQTAHAQSIRALSLLHASGTKLVPKKNRDPAVLLC